MDYEFDRALLKRTLKKKKITYAKLVELLQQRGINLTENAVKFWFGSMKGKPTLDKAKVIADILNIPFNDLAKQSVFTTGNIQTIHGDNNANIQGDNNKNNSNSNININGNDDIVNIVFEEQEYNKIGTSDKVKTKAFKEFMSLFIKYGNDKMLLPLIEKLRQAEKILEN